MSRYKRPSKREPRDYLGNLIEVDDVYFYGSPPTFGKILSIKGSMVVIGYAMDGEVYTMKCHSPGNGICINKV